MENDSRAFRLRRAASFAVLYLVWGSTYLGIRIGVAHFPPALFASIRFLLAAPLLLGITLLMKGSLQATRAQLFHSAIVGIALLVGGNFLVVWAEQYVPSGLSCLIGAGTPIWMTGMEQMRKGGERISGLGWAGIAVGFSGVFLLVDPGSFTGSPSDGRTGLAAFAEFALLGSSLLWSAGSIYSKHVSLPKNAMASTGYQMLFGGLALALIAAGRGEYASFSFADIPAKAWWVLGYLIVFGSIIGLTAYVWLIRHVPAAQVSTYAYVNPVVAVVLGFVVLDESVGWRTILGMTIISTGVLLVSRAKLRAVESP